MTAPRWSFIAGILTIMGSVAWLAKFAVIVGTDGRVTDTGAAAWFLRLGVACLILGASGFAIWLTRHSHWVVCLAALLLSPIIFFTSFLLVDNLAKAAIGTFGPDYLSKEAGIAVTAIVWFGLGIWLLVATRRHQDKMNTRPAVA